MAKRDAKSKTIEKATSEMVKNFQKILSKHGLDDHQITKFSLGQINTPMMLESASGCPEGEHSEYICTYVGPDYVCAWTCVPD